MTHKRVQTCSSQGRQKGLTLIELLVAISVLAFVAVLGYRGLDSIVRARVALTSDLEQTRGMQLTFAQLQSDGAHLASPELIPGREPLAAVEGRLTLVRTVFADNQPPRLQVVTYRLKDGVFNRRESAATRDLKEIDALWQAAASDTEKAQEVQLQSGVSALSMRLWYGAAQGWRAANAPPATADNATPVVTPGGHGQIMPSYSNTPTGLEVSLKLQGREANMIKVFLLGPV
ncbi:MAG: prepilin-type N-terminal cleavage/methylation domain-containing protein [Pseudomonadota bacterium]